MKGHTQYAHIPPGNYMFKVNKRNNEQGVTYVQS